VIAVSFTEGSRQASEPTRRESCI